MSACKIFFFLLLALCVLCGTCNVLYGQVGSVVLMDCEVPSDSDVKWTFDNNLIYNINGKRGTKQRGYAHMVSRAVANGGNLKIQNLEPRDSGVYACTQTGKQFTVRVVSVFVSPAPVLVQSSNAELHCKIHGSPLTPVQWLKPDGQTHAETKQELVLKSVTSREEGTWTCVIDKLKPTVTLTVVAALHSQDVEVFEGDSVELPCSLPRPVSQAVVGGKWKADNLPANSKFPTLEIKDKSVHWKGENSSKVTFTSGQLSTNYNVMLINAQREDQGTYECTVQFEAEGKLTAKISLTVSPKGLKKSNTETGKTPQPKETLNKAKETLNKLVFGVKLWIWIAVGASSVVLIGLIVVTVLVQQRNKRMKKRVRKLKSLRPVTANDYCHCNRYEEQVQLGHREAPLPVPRQPRPGKGLNHTSDRSRVY